MIRPGLLSAAALAAGPALVDIAASQEPFHASVWFEPGETLFGHHDSRIIPTNRWIWIETRPGIFAPDPSGPIRTDWAGVVETGAEAEAALTTLAATLPAERAEGLWCLEWATEADAPRLACME
jgi:hypothetical protein